MMSKRALKYFLLPLLCSFLPALTIIHLPKTGNHYTRMFHFNKIQPLREFQDKAGPKVLQKDSLNNSRNPFCPSLSARQKHRHYTYKDHIPSQISWKSLLDMTHPNFTSFHITKTNRNNAFKYFVCDELRLIIQARNGINESKTYGGDYFRAKIYTKNSTFQASSMSDGEVVDHGNGTYSALFTLKWAGLVNIQVTLVHTSEANYVLRRFQKEEVIRIKYQGRFYSKESKKSKETYCNMDLKVLQKTTAKKKVETESCNFTDTRTGAPWFCVKPQDFPCSDYVMHHGAGSALSKRDTSNIERLSFTWKDQRITGSENSIVVHHMPGKESVVHSGAVNHLPACTPKIQFGTPQVAGFYWGKNWLSADCGMHTFNKSRAISLLRNKTVHLLGDSTIRQLFEFYVELFELETGSKLLPLWYYGPTIVKDSKNNITFHFQFHGLPNGRGAWGNISNFEYIANIIDRIKGGENTIFVLTLWAHFTPHPPLYYEARVESMLTSIRRLHVRSPRTLVIWKSANTREHGRLDHLLRNSDWTARDLDRRMRNKVFAYENIGFMDAWDMTNAQFEKHALHPIGSHVENLSNKLLSYVLNHDKKE
ncbi:NXPE family member 3-like [Lytechinus pictus]|uniref:NXPE family member 3-like n=1 Tax=Lytechinus pictus TaxID=7653 RepID=UPI0030B9F46E